MPDNQSIIATEALGTMHRSSLAALLDTMIPESSEFNVPGAGDDAIVDDVLHSIRAASAQMIIDGLATLEQTSNEDTGKAFSEHDTDSRQKLFSDLRLANHNYVRVLGSIAIQCYYRDDRVMVSLGMEPRPPFPKGFDVEQGDWSLLDPVRGRGKIYRDVE